MGFLSRLFGFRSHKPSGKTHVTASEFGRVLHNVACDGAKRMDEQLGKLGVFEERPVRYSPTYSTELLIYAMAPLDFALDSALTTLPRDAAARVRAAMHQALIEILLRDYSSAQTSEQWLNHITMRFRHYRGAFEIGDIEAVGRQAAAALGLVPHAMTTATLFNSFTTALEVYPKTVINTAEITG